MTMTIPTLAPGRQPTATLGGISVGGAHPVVVIGVLNVSPESFYAPSVHEDAAALRTAARAMVERGAGLLDIGAMSTAPYGHGSIDEEEERARLVAAVEAIAGDVPVPISVDTARPGPLSAAVDAGARVLNDVSGLADARVAALVRERGLGVIAMASPAAARAAGVSIDRDDPVGTVAACLQGSLARARAAGVPEHAIVVDPGIGFFLDEAAARAEWDVRVLARLSALATLNRPLVVGVSRKSFVGALTGRSAPSDRLPGSLAATALAVAGGAAAIRTHDVGETLDAVRVAERVARAGQSRT